jgi:hypothetical protein
MTIEHEAFIDLEQTLHRKVDRLWQKQWTTLQKKINTAANAGDWEQAYRLCDEIDFTEIVMKTRRLARTLAEAALFLGASRIVEPEAADFYGQVDQNLVERATDQWQIVLTRNAQESLRIQAKNYLSAIEADYQEKQLQRIVKSELGKVGAAGKQFSQATAALMISRMSTMGFMLQAMASGVQTYRVNEVMDSRTCPICATMHNKHFPVSDGWGSISSQMMAADPESIRAMNPFPSQSKANVKRVSSMGEGQLIAAGMNLPPYHPNCRGIVTLEQKNRGAAALPLGGLAAGQRMLQTEQMSPDQLAARMFGEFDDLDDAYIASMLGAGGAAIYDGGEE